MNRIVRENYPVVALPADLREGFKLDANVRVVIEVATEETPQEEPPLTWDELFALRRPPYRSMEEIVAEVRRDRDEWDD